MSERRSQPVGEVPTTDGVEIMNDRRSQSPAPAASKGAEADDPYEEESLGALILSNQSQNAPFGECSFCKSAIRDVHTQACLDRAVSPEASEPHPDCPNAFVCAGRCGNRCAEVMADPSEPEAQKAVEWWARCRLHPKWREISKGQAAEYRESGREVSALGVVADPAASMEDAATLCEGLAEMMEQGAGEARPGQRLRQAARGIRALAEKNGWRLGEGQ